MTTKIYTKADISQWDSVKKDILGSIEANLDEMFKKAHLLKINQNESDIEKRCFLYFDFCEKNYVYTETLVIPNKLFTLIEKK